MGEEGVRDERTIVLERGFGYFSNRGDDCIIVGMVSKQADGAVAVSNSAVTMGAPAAVVDSQAFLLWRDWKWVAGAGIVYALAVVVSVLTLNVYFSQTWDAVTFVNAGTGILSPQWAQLYASSRAESYWPYAYPPLHALVVAPFVALAGMVPDWLPAWLAVRIPPLGFDIALGVLLYVVVGEKTGRRNWARLALVVWLLNPVTWYDTAVQGHFEGEWLFFVGLGYWLFERGRGWVWASLALAIAFLFKQNSILFALPLWAGMLFGTDDERRMTNEKGRTTKEKRGTWGKRLRRVVGSMVVYAVPIVAVSLPFLLASNDYFYMNVQYVAEVPLQTQSWLVALANGVGADSGLLKLSSALVFVAAGVIAVVAARRGMGFPRQGSGQVWLTALLIGLVFFLLSKKVVGYYYVMVLPFALVTLVPTKHFRVLTLIVGMTAFVSLAPYFASWANQVHGGVYGLLGILNSLVWVGVFVWVWREFPLAVQFGQNARTPIILSVGLFCAGASAAVLQPLIGSAASPIRAPLVASGGEGAAVLAGLGFVALVAIGLGMAWWISRVVARETRLGWGAVALVVLLAPVSFLTFTLTKESTAALEAGLKLVGW